jgi:two-component sensor histidine kinase
MNPQNAPVEQLVGAPDLAEALKGNRFKEFLDKIPIAILLAAMQPDEQVVYANAQFELLTGEAGASVEGKPWGALKGRAQSGDRELSQAIVEGIDHIGAFVIERPGAEPILVEAYSNVIETDDGIPDYRLVALIPVSIAGQAGQESWEQSLRDKDLLLQELQHRVKNNLQMITALIRLESRSWPEGAGAFSRLSGRIEALSILYQCLSPNGDAREVDLGAYLGQVAAAVMRGNASEGIRLALEVDVFPVSVNIAMPAGLLINELMTNALKHAFAGREEGTITVQSLPDAIKGRKIIVADDGVGLPAEVVWPQPGKLTALIAKSLRENAKAEVEVESSAGRGTKVTFLFSGNNHAPQAG